MMWLSRLFSKPEPIPHVVIRHVVSTKSENREASLRRETVANDLRCLTADLTPSQRAKFKARASIRTERAG